METPEKPERTPGRLAIAFAGRFFAVLATTIIGCVLGMAAGAYRSSLTPAVPIGGKATMGMESAGVAEVIVWVINLLVGAAVGTLLGLLVGMIGMIVYRMVKTRRHTSE